MISLQVRDGHSFATSSILSANSSLVMIILISARLIRYFRSFGVSIVGAGTVDCTPLDERDRRGPPLGDAGEHDHDPVALVDPVLDQHVHDLVREPHQVPERELLLLAFLVHPDHRELVPVLVRPCVDDVEPEVEILGHIDMEVLVGLLVVGHIVDLALVGSTARRQHGRATGEPALGLPRIFVVQASLIHSDRESFRISQSLSIFSVRLSSIDTEYRTIQIRLVVQLIGVSVFKCTTKTRICTGCPDKMKAQRL